GALGYGGVGGWVWRRAARNRTADPLRRLPLGSGDEHLRPGKRFDPADMVGVQVRQHHPTKVAQLVAESRELWRDFVLRTELEPREPEERVPGREVAGLGRTSRLSGV